MNDQIDQVEPKLTFSPASMQPLNRCIAFIMFGVALDIKPEHFVVQRNQKKALAPGLISQYMLLPLATWLLVAALRPAEGIAMGMLLVAACHGGNVSNFFTMLSRGNVAHSVTLTAFTSLACLVVIPVIFFQLISLSPGLSGSMRELDNRFVDLLINMTGLLLTPLVFGMFDNHKWPVAAEKIGRFARMLSVMILAGFIVATLTNNLQVFREQILEVFWLVMIHNGAGLLGGCFFSKTLGNKETTNRAAAIETGIQNTGLALVLIFTFFDGNVYMALIAAWWGVWHLISGFSFAFFFRRRPISETA